MSHNVWVKSGKVYNLLDNSITTDTGTSIFKDAPAATFQAYGTTSAGAGAAVILIQGSNVDVTANFITIGTIGLTLGTSSTSDGFTTTAPWKYVRAKVSSISGTNATVSVVMGV